MKTVLILISLIGQLVTAVAHADGDSMFSYEVGQDSGLFRGVWSATGPHLDVECDGSFIGICYNPDITPYGSSDACSQARSQAEDSAWRLCISHYRRCRRDEEHSRVAWSGGSCSASVYYFGIGQRR